ncbi:MAG: Rieske (2Fe-2S) protein [Marinilabiliales bacterium]|nr:Rieske (2Fe-2S) protein [Marinilabiliales bacterium]
MNRVSRSQFIRLISFLPVAFAMWLWYQLTRSGRVVTGRYRHPATLPMGVTFAGAYFLFRDGSGVKAFSTRCTHAGCRLERSSGNRILCSCHGSAFDAATGLVAKGPAYRSLESIDCQQDAVTGEWVVQMSKANK